MRVTNSRNQLFTLPTLYYPYLKDPLGDTSSNDQYFVKDIPKIGPGISLLFVDKVHICTEAGVSARHFICGDPVNRSETHLDAARHLALDRLG